MAYRQSPASFSANKNGVDQTGIADATFTKLTFTNEAWDVGGFYDAANSRWVPPAGKVRINGTARFNSGLNATSTASLALYKNGAAYSQVGAYHNGAETTYVSLCVIDNANGTDYYELWVFGTTGSTITVSGSSAVSLFQGEQI